MVKVEKLSPDALVWFTRDGVRQRAWLHQLISRDELSTLEVESGTVVYSVDEQDVVSRSANATKSAAPAATPVEAPPAPATPPVAAATEPKPKIVFPSKTTKRK